MVAKYTELRYSFIVPLSVLLLAIVWSDFIRAQSNGDVRIINPNDTSRMGRLEVYLDGEWGTFCANGFDSYSADAACRQLGYQISIGDVSKASDFIYYIPLASNSTPIHTGISTCFKTNDGGVSHVLRCLNLDFSFTCMHDDDVIIDCSPFTLDMEGYYDTELFLNSKALNSTYRSSGVLEIFSNSLGGWSNICGTKFDQNAANTACIQLGYTGALSYTTSAHRTKEILYTDIWLDGVTCGDSVYSCLDSCFCYPPTLTAVPCDPGNVVALTCTFDLAKQSQLHFPLPGSRDLCEEDTKTVCAASDMPTTEIPINFIILSSVLSAVIVFLSLVVVGLIMVMAWNCRGRAHYQAIN